MSNHIIWACWSGFESFDGTNLLKYILKVQFWSDYDTFCFVSCCQSFCRHKQRSNLRPQEYTILNTTLIKSLKCVAKTNIFYHQGDAPPAHSQQPHNTQKQHSSQSVQPVRHFTWCHLTSLTFSPSYQPTFPEHVQTEQSRRKIQCKTLSFRLSAVIHPLEALLWDWATCIIVPNLLLLHRLSFLGPSLGSSS